MSKHTTVIYNAGCPICSREIESYRRYSERRALPLRFEAIEAANLSLWGLTPEDAARRLHVIKDGELLRGVPAFAALWQEMPRFRWLARIVRLPVMRQAAHGLYEGVLAPALYALHRRRVRRRPA